VRGIGKYPDRQESILILTWKCMVRLKSMWGSVWSRIGWGRELYSRQIRAGHRKSQSLTVCLPLSMRVIHTMKGDRQALLPQMQAKLAEGTGQAGRRRR
jgi:hypothetical protein